MDNLTRSPGPGQTGVADAPAGPGTDLEWLREEAESLLEGPDADGSRSVASWAVRALTDAMAFHGHDSAEWFLADPQATACAAEVRALVAPAARDRRTGLARALDAQAAWYLHLDTPAARLAAWALVCRATEADTFGSETGRDFEYDEAAFRMARDEALIEAGYCYL